MDGSLQVEDFCFDFCSWDELTLKFKKRLIRLDCAL